MCYVPDGHSKCRGMFEGISPLGFEEISRSMQLSRPDVFAHAVRTDPYHERHGKTDHANRIGVEFHSRSGHVGLSLLALCNVKLSTHAKICDRHFYNERISPDPHSIFEMNCLFDCETLKLVPNNYT